MNCRNCHNRLQDLLEGKLAGAVRREVDAHLEGCADCREMLELMGLGPAAQSGADVAAEVLRRTSGSPCERAHEILCDHADGALENGDTELLTLHMARCAGCAALSRALMRLPEDLAPMAELVPGEDFVGGVLAAIRPRPSRWVGIAASWVASWNALLARPRLAWEAGYIGAVAMWFVWGALGTPISAAAARDLAAPTTVVRAVGDQVTNLGQQAWAVSGGKGLEAFGGVTTDLATRYERTEPARFDLQLHGSRLKTAALELDVQESRKAFKELKWDARFIWERFVSEDTETE